MVGDWWLVVGGGDHQRHDGARRREALTPGRVFLEHLKVRDLALGRFVLDIEDEGRGAIHSTAHREAARQLLAFAVEQPPLHVRLERARAAADREPVRDLLAPRGRVHDHERGVGEAVVTRERVSAADARDLLQCLAREAEPANDQDGRYLGERRVGRPLDDRHRDDAFVDREARDAYPVAEEDGVGVVEFALLVQQRVQVAEVPAAARVLDRDGGGVREAVAVEVAEGPLAEADHEFAGRAGRDRRPELAVLERGRTGVGVLGQDGGRLKVHPGHPIGVGYVAGRQRRGCDEQHPHGRRASNSTPGPVSHRHIGSLAVGCQLQSSPNA